MLISIPTSSFVELLLRLETRLINPSAQGRGRLSDVGTPDTVVNRRETLHKVRPVHVDIFKAIVEVVSFDLLLCCWNGENRKPPCKLDPTLEEMLRIMFQNICSIHVRND